jgi:hypothetical protein
MDITPLEYTQRRSLFQHCDWVNQKLRDLETTPKFYESYLERKGLNIKRLLEEAVPVAYLGLYFWRAWRDIFVTCLASNEPYDAVVELHDPRSEQRVQVEVTTIETEETTLRRQALAREGIAFLTGRAWREGRTIRTEPEVVDVDEECGRILEIAFERFRTKAERERDPETAILVYVNTYRLLPAWHRHQLIERTRLYLLQHQPMLYGVYYCYHPELGVDGLRNDVHEL